MSNSKLETFFTKGTVVFVVILSLMISNFRIYSAIGDYQTSSQAITANNNYKKSSDRIEKPSVLVGGIGAGFALGTLAVAASLLAVGVVATATVASLAAAASIEYNSAFIKNDLNYSKYNFSQFDNYTPSSMKPARFVNTLKNRR